MAVRRQWAIWLIGGLLGAAIALAAIYLLRVRWDIGWLESLVCLLLLMSLGDLLLVWDNRRAEKAGKVRFWNRATADTAVVVADFSPASDQPFRGKVRFDGELWSAFSDTKLAEGDRVRIRQRNGLDLQVERSIK